jgi:hypothetical protein
VIPVTYALAPLPDLYSAMNKTEKRRAVELEAMKRAGQIAAWWFEAWTFKLAPDTRFTPDFVIQENDGALRAEEIKGFWREDARVKSKVFANQFPLPLRVFRQAKGGTWDIEEIG